MLEEHLFPDRALLIEGLAQSVATRLLTAVKARGQACLVVSGGKTPAHLFAALAPLPLPWERVTVTLADERFVHPGDEDSNERLVKSTLLKDRAAAAQFISLRGTSPTLEAAAAQARSAIDALPQPFDVVLLGMGEDGHTASLFPDAPELGEAMNAEAPSVLVLHPGSAPHARLSLSAPILRAGRMIVLLIEGAAKRKTLARAMSIGADTEMPIRYFINAEGALIHGYWAP